jgi:spore coat protein A
MMRDWEVGAGAVALAVFCSSTLAQPVTVNIGAARDATLIEHPSVDLADGAGQYFFAGMTNQSPGERIRRAAIMFDVASAVPAGSTITGVTLTLYCSRVATNDDRLVRLHRLTADWGEGASVGSDGEGKGAPASAGDVTWRHRFYSTALWTVSGGDFIGPASGSILVGRKNLTYTWPSTAGMVADVQMWLNTPAMNFGWMLVGDESAAQTTKRFNSRQNSDAARRPVLSVTYTPPAGIGACCFPDGSCQDLTEGACTGSGGTFQGAGTNCATANCPQPTGACCLGDESCLVLTIADCASMTGTYQGHSTTCSPNPCTVPTGACCLADGSCLVLTMSNCSATGGAYQGDGTTCSPNPCPQPPGACCFSGAACADLTEEDCIAQGGLFEGDFTTCAATQCPLNLAHFVDPLPIPPAMQSVSGQSGGAATYDISIRQFQQQLHRDLPPTTCWGYGGTYPAATIEAFSGTPITVNWINDLRDSGGALRTSHYLSVDLCPHGAADDAQVVTHLHGGHVPAEVDGYPEDTFTPGNSATYIYPNNQPPGTLWFHDHALGITRLNVYMGMAGFYLIRDQFELDLGLPSGEFEIPLAIQDRMFNLDGSFSYPAAWQDRLFGDTILVNGKVWPYLNVKQGKYRFRMLGGANSRTFRVALSNGASFQVIGTDGGLLPAPVTVSQLTIQPGERYDVIMDFQPYAAGTEIVLVNDAPAPYPGTPGIGVIPDVMKFIVTAEAGHTASIPASLRPVEPLLEADADKSRIFELEKVADAGGCTANVWKINGLGWHDITEYPELGDTEIWSFINKSGVSHPMHMHLVFFQLLDRQAFEVIDGVITPVGMPAPPAPYEAGWKDTIEVGPFEIVRVIARFEDYEGLYAYHCHILEHEDHEMMRQFRTRQPCPADINDDRTVDVTDLLDLLAAWGGCPAPPASCPEDTNEDGQVDVTDLLALLAAWGPCP